MKELSLNILDIVQNSVKAGATRIDILITEKPAEDYLAIEIIDNGCGMDAEFLARVTDPFTTTRTTRKVGLGIPFFKMAAESTGGDFTITSQPGKGTRVKATFGYHHIDRMPMGDLVSTITLLIQGNPEIDFVYTHEYEDRKLEFSCHEVREQLGDQIPLNEPAVLDWIRGYLQEQTNLITGGTEL